MTTSSKSEEESYKGRINIYYESVLNTWFTFKLERTRHLLNVSLAAIGVLITLLKTLELSRLDVSLFIGAIISFFAVILVSLFGFDKNAEYLQEIIRKVNDGEDPETSNNGSMLLDILDFLEKFSFIVATVFLVLIAVSYNCSTPENV